MGVPVIEPVYRNRVVTEVAAAALRSPGADLTDPAAMLAGVTGELATTSDDPLCQGWAQAIWTARSGVCGTQPGPRPGAERQRGPSSVRPVLSRPGVPPRTGSWWTYWRGWVTRAFARMS